MVCGGRAARERWMDGEKMDRWRDSGERERRNSIDR